MIKLFKIVTRLCADQACSEGMMAKYVLHKLLNIKMDPFLKYSALNKTKCFYQKLSASTKREKNDVPNKTSL
ncbi:MAG: hypothetical protein LHW41_07865 [Candidatus Cloacimonetes bacterium]|nr:hypothetical protein [Candidatus Cloacimonadota bacterium]